MQACKVIITNYKLHYYRCLVPHLQVQALSPQFTPTLSPLVLTLPPPLFLTQLWHTHYLILSTPVSTTAGIDIALAVLQLCWAIRGSGFQWGEVDLGITLGLVSGVESRGFPGLRWQRSGCQGVPGSSAVQGKTLCYNSSPIYTYFLALLTFDAPRYPRTAYRTPSVTGSTTDSLN